jgi:hypothetical protein
MLISSSPSGSEPEHAWEVCGGGTLETGSRSEADGATVCRRQRTL